MATTFGERKEANGACDICFSAAGSEANDARSTSRPASEAATRDADAAGEPPSDLARRPADLERLANWRTLAAGSSSFAASASVVSATTRLVSSSCIRQRATAILQSACRPEMMHATGGRSGGRLCAAAFLALFCGASAAAVRFIDVDSMGWVGLRAPIVQDAPIVLRAMRQEGDGETGQVQ